MSRTGVTGPAKGAYITFTLKLAANTDTPSFVAPCALRVMAASFYARTSTSGTITVTSTDPAVTIHASGALTADTALNVNGGSLTNRTINRGSVIKAAGGGTLADGTCVLTCVTSDHVVSAGPLPDPND